MNRTAIRNELYRRGELSFLFHSGQRELNRVFKEAKYSVIVFNVSRQWGKTYFAVAKAIELAIRKPKARIRYATAFETDLAEFSEPAFEAVLATCPEALKPKYIAHRKRYIFPNGSIIRLIGLDRKPNGLRGNTIDFIILDEAGFTSRLNYLHTSVIVPLTTHRPNAKILLISTPPESPDHDFWDFVDRAKLDGAYCEFTIDENPMLSRPDVERIEREMGGRHTTAFRREYLCERIVEEHRAIVPEWDSKRFIGEMPTDEYSRWYQRVEAMDIGVKQDFTFVAFSTFHFRLSKLFVHDLILMNGPEMTTDKLAKAIDDKERGLWLDEKTSVARCDHRVADNSHPLLIQDLVSHKDYPKAFSEIEKDKLHEMVNELRIWVRSGRLIVSPKCKPLFGALESGIWNEKRTEFARSKNFGHYDAVAAMVYLIRYVAQSVEHYNPIPVNANKDPYNYFILPEPRLSQTAKTLTRVFR